MGILPAGKQECCSTLFSMPIKSDKRVDLLHNSKCKHFCRFFKALKIHACAGRYFHLASALMQIGLFTGSFFFEY
jgi:hypothetical protein